MNKTGSTKEADQMTGTSSGKGEPARAKPEPVKMTKEQTTIKEPSLDQGPDWEKISRIENDSLAARWELEKWSLIRELHRAYVETVTFYMKPQGGGLSMEEAIKLASKEIDGTELGRELEQIATWNVENISWYTLDRVFKASPSLAQRIWEDIKEEAEKDFKSGHFAAKLFERTDWQNDPWKRAQFIAVRDSFIEEFEPQGGMEYSMIDMLAVSYFLWMHWTQEHLQRATTEPRQEDWDYKEWREQENRRHHYSVNGKTYSRRYNPQYSDGYWDIPYQSEAEAIEHSARLADRYRRAYQSQLRAMRDWRRYGGPVIVQNAQQVNVAADGGQQVNVQKKDKPKKKRTPAKQPVRVVSKGPLPLSRVSD